MKQKLNKTAAAYFMAAISFSFILSGCQKDAVKSKFTNDIVSSSGSDKAIEKSLAGSLVAKYSFNGNTNDLSSNGNDVIFNSATTASGYNGEPNTAYYFNGGQWMEVANSPSLSMQKITLMALVQPQGFYQRKCHDNRIVSKGYNDYWKGRYTLEFSDMLYYNYEGCYEPVKESYQNFGGSFGNGQGTASGTVDSNHFIIKDRWYSLVYTYDGKSSRLYVNGELVSETKTITSFTPNTRNLFFGRNEDHKYPYFFTGIIDQIRIYNTPVSPSQAKALTKVMLSE